MRFTATQKWPILFPEISATCKKIYWEDNSSSIAKAHKPQRCHMGGMVPFFWFLSMKQEGVLLLLPNPPSLGEFKASQLCFKVFDSAQST